MNFEGCDILHIPILYEDNHLLIVNKPNNMPVQEDQSKDPDLLTLLKQDLKIRYKKPGNVFLGLVHRLDRPVGGIITFAKTSKAASRLSDLLRKKAFERRYIAIVKGSPPKKSGKLEHYLWKNRKTNIVQAVHRNNKDGKKAIMYYNVLKESGTFRLLNIELETGRSHQIRVQLKTVGCPIVGDIKYGEKITSRSKFPIALLANSVSFKHPTKDEKVQIEISPPKTYPWSLFY